MFSFHHFDIKTFLPFLNRKKIGPDQDFYTETLKFFIQSVSNFRQLGSKFETVCIKNTVFE